MLTYAIILDEIQELDILPENVYTSLQIVYKLGINDDVSGNEKFWGLLSKQGVLDHTKLVIVHQRSINTHRNRNQFA